MGRAALDAGIRVNLSRACTDKEGVDSVTGLYRQWQGQGQGRIRVSMGVHAEYTSTPQVVAYAVEKGRALGAGFHIHLSETQGEVEGCRQRHGVSPVQYFRDLGLFDSPTLPPTASTWTRRTSPSWRKKGCGRYTTRPAT